MDEQQLKNRTHTQKSQPGQYENGIECIDKTLKSMFEVNATELDICEVCGDPLQMLVELLGVVKRVPIACTCRKKEIAQSKQRSDYLDTQRRIDKYRAYSMMDQKFRSSTFEDWDFELGDERLYYIGQKYCDLFDDIRRKGIGFTLYGKAGNGKTYLSFAIANELEKRNITCMAVSVNSIISKFFDSYNNVEDRLNESHLFNLIYDVELLILDDLGTENKTNFTYEKLYRIIDTRCRSGKPLIITSNLSKEQLRENLRIIDKSGVIDESERIFNRVIEMSPLIEATGKSLRIKKGAENAKELFELLSV